MYRFRFQSVLRYRRQIEDQAQREFADLQKRLMTEYSRLEMIEQSRRGYIKEFEKRQPQGLTLREITLYNSFFERLEWDSDLQRKNLYLLNQEVEAKRQELLEVSKKKKTLEKLKEDEAEKYLEEEEREEQILNDEVAVNKAARCISIARDLH